MNLDTERPSKARNSKLYVLRVRQSDGSWVFDMDNPMPKKDAEYQAKQSRILGGILCQLWTEQEAASVLADPPASGADTPLS